MNSYRNWNSYLSRETFFALLAIKDSDIRLDTLYQGNHGVDKGIHIGGSFSETIPLVTLFYGGYIQFDVENPTSSGNDIFVLSKGHGIAAMVSVLSDQGLIDRKIFDHCRGYDSNLNGHPGPILPGIHVSTGPLGQGICVAAGFANVQKIDEKGKTFCLMGDGEIQEGMPWEAFMYAADKKLSNLCVIVDCNQGQNDNTRKLMLSIGDLKAKFEAFGFEAAEVDGTNYATMWSAFEQFHNRVSEKPFAILSHCKKGEGGFGVLTEKHKPTLDDNTYIRETELQNYRRDKRVRNFCSLFARLCKEEPLESKKISKAAEEMLMEIIYEDDCPITVRRRLNTVKTKRAPERCKKLTYHRDELPKPELGKFYKCSDIVSEAAAAFGRDSKMVTLDADMGLITGLQPGMERTSRERALNVGIAESNMMGIAEAFAACGYNVWCSTFGMFFDWRVLRRISVSQQERFEAIEETNGWLNQGHSLDITFLAAAANIDTQVNGATHMSIDDVTALMQVPHVRVIDVACPRMMLAVMEWIAEGNRGLVLLRMTRADTRTIYGADFRFEFGKGYIHGNLDEAGSVIITSGRGIYEGLEAKSLLEQEGINCAVVDMPSFDEDLMSRLTAQNKNLIFVEQNNGFLFQYYLDAMYKNHIAVNPNRIAALSTRDQNRSLRHLHSATYKELTKACGLRATDLSAAVAELCGV